MTTILPKLNARDRRAVEARLDLQNKMLAMLKEPVEHFDPALLTPQNRWALEAALERCTVEETSHFILVALYYMTEAGKAGQG